ncbi:MAG: hypothetical protein RIA69_03520 [Cyclobacteriaceae bacterium]|uniref:hypothetical protein n=1 Tax=Fulvivirga sp. TaxID=1931237 RepID=UPI0032EB256B
MKEFELYKSRNIDFRGVQKVDDWYVKVYTISIHKKFKSDITLDAVLKNSAAFINIPKNSKLPTYEQAFVIIHEAREGVWILFSWWTGGEMLETVVHFSSYLDPALIEPSPHPNSLVCTWELEVFIHERNAWIEHILKKAQKPDFKSYLNDVIR